MKKRYLFLGVIMALAITLTSCNGSKFQTIDDYKNNLVDYNNKVSMETYKKLNNVLENHRQNHLDKDVTINTYYYTKTKSKSSDSDIIDSNYETIETSLFTRMIDYDKKLLHENRTSDTVSHGKSLDGNNESTKHVIEEFGYQELSGYMVYVDKIDKYILRLGDNWKNLKERTYPENDFFVFPVDINDDYYVDNDVYTAYSVNASENKEKIKQIIVNDQKLSLLEIEKYSYDTGIITSTHFDIVDATYIDVTYKDLNLEPIDVKGFKSKKVGEI